MEGLYIESSALTSILLEDSREFDAALESVNRPILSALTLLEARRAIRRDSRAGRIDAQAATKLLRRIRSLRTRSQVLPIDDHVLEQAEQDFHVEPVRSLDAIHLATALIWSANIGPVRVASIDRRIRQNAVALGFPVVP